jgi:hypothetical protein
MTNIYDQHKAAFANVAAYVVLHNGERVATIAFKYPRDGAGRLYAYVHWFGTEMVRGYAGGGGYDKHSAACADAARKIKGGDMRGRMEEAADAFVAELGKNDGYYWHDNLRNAGFTVLQAV